MLPHEISTKLFSACLPSLFLVVSPPFQLEDEATLPYWAQQFAQPLSLSFQGGSSSSPFTSAIRALVIFLEPGRISFSQVAFALV